MSKFWKAFIVYVVTIVLGLAGGIVTLCVAPDGYRILSVFPFLVVAMVGIFGFFCIDVNTR